MGPLFFGYMASMSGACKAQVLSGELKSQTPPHTFSIGIQGGASIGWWVQKCVFLLNVPLGIFLGIVALGQWVSDVHLENLLQIQILGWTR